ncbi:hypothetical protein LXJ15735_01820 [Lacrimispora xylanolytica]
MNIGREVGNVLHFSEQLDILHKHISFNELPVKKRDAFDEQCILLEEYLGEDNYKNVYKRMRTLNILSGVMAFPVLLLIIGVIVYSKLNEEVNIFAFILENTFLWIGAGVLLALILIVSLLFYITKNKLYNKIYPELKHKLNIK